MPLPIGTICQRKVTKIRKNPPSLIYEIEPGKDARPVVLKGKPFDTLYSFIGKLVDFVCTGYDGDKPVLMLAERYYASRTAPKADAAAVAQEASGPEEKAKAGQEAAEPSEQIPEVAFVKGEILDFQFDRFRYFDNEKYMILRLPQVGTSISNDHGWFFRVKPMRFQEDWDEDDFTSFGPIPCEVMGFMKDKDTGEQTNFPILGQSRMEIENRLYPESLFSLLRKFTLMEKQDGPFPFKLYDEAYSYQFSCKAIGLEANVGDELTLHVKHDRKGFIVLTDEDFCKREKEQAALNRIPNVFAVDGVYEATVTGRQQLGNGNRSMVSLCLAALPELQYFIPERRDVPVHDGDQIKVRCIGFTQKGYPKWEYAENVHGLPVAHLEVMDDALPDESLTVEYKSSLVYANDGSGAVPEPNRQLGYEITRVIASFMNAEGGRLYIGVTDDKCVCGIENEANCLNENSDSGKTYPSTTDGISRKIQDTLVDKLDIGNGCLGLVDIGFRRSNENHLICVVDVKPNLAQTPVFMGGDQRLFVRFGASSRELTGKSFFAYAANRTLRGLRQPSSIASGAQATAPETPKAPDATSAQTAQNRTEEVPGLVEERVSNRKIDVICNDLGGYIYLYGNGDAASSSPQRNIPAASSDLLCRIPVPRSALNEKSRLLFCYNSGNVNVLNPKWVMNEYLKKRGKRRQNGVNTENKLVAAHVCGRNDAVVLLVRRADGSRSVKIVKLDGRTVHTTMATQGNDFGRLKHEPEGTELLGYRLLPESMQDSRVLSIKWGKWLSLADNNDFATLVPQLPEMGLPL